MEAKFFRVLYLQHINNMLISLRSCYLFVVLHALYLSPNLLQNVYNFCGYTLYFHTVAPAPFLITALATLGTGNNYLISKGNL